MTAITWNQSSTTSQDGIQSFDARHHLRQVAELISEVFADELDANGRGALQEMQFVSRFSPILGGLLSTAFFSEFVLGYVWVESGRVIGNVTFQRADAAGSRWRISNVGVKPAYRRKGIARALMLASLREIALRGGNWTILQVRTDNPGARRLYENLKFTDVCQDGVWRWEPTGADLSALPVPDPAILLRPLSATHWQERLELARSTRSPLADWVEPLQPSAYRPRAGHLFGELLGNLTGLQPVKRWGIRQDGRLAGAVETIAEGSDGAHCLRFDARPDVRGQFETALVARGLRDLAGQPPRPIMAEHSGDDPAGVAALEAYQFKPQRILLTMRRMMSPADAS